MGLEVILMFAACAMASRAYPGTKENPKPSWYFRMNILICSLTGKKRLYFYAIITPSLFTFDP